MYTKFLITYYDFNKSCWVCEIIKYYGDHYERDPNDWRFCEVNNKRLRLEFLGYEKR